MSCEKHGRYSIGRLPRDYVQLSIFLAKEGGGIGGGIPIPKAEAPIPIRLDIEALMTEVRTSLLTWERDVRYLARLSPVPQIGVRHGIAVDRAAHLLYNHYSVLMALKLPSAATDGTDGIIELTRLHHRCINLVGESVQWEWKELPCPGCQWKSLGRWIGSSSVECVQCDWTCTLDEYFTYSITFIPPRREHDKSNHL